MSFYCIPIMEGARAHRTAWASHMVGVDSAFKLSKRNQKSQVADFRWLGSISPQGRDASFNGMGFRGEAQKILKTGSSILNIKANVGVWQGSRQDSSRVIQMVKLYHVVFERDLYPSHSLIQISSILLHFAVQNYTVASLASTDYSCLVMMRVFLKGLLC